MRPIDPLKRQAIRAALGIHDHLAGASRLNTTIQLPTEAWEETARLAQRLNFTLRRGWKAASDSLQMDLEHALRRLRSDCDNCQANLPRPPRYFRLAPPGEIVADILALDAEFDGLAINLQERLLQVQTDPIVLEDTVLGSFRIELRWERIGSDSRAYEVIAESPNTPEHDESVTHPHVRDGLLCEGEGAAPIRRALTEGRLLDFFTVVRQILGTYNPGSAYVELGRWNGATCKDCGYIMPGEGHGSCDHCEDPLCSDCSVHCPRCESYICSSCSASCEACERLLCESCLQAADDGRLLCSSCFDESHEEPNDDLSEEDPAPEAAVCPAGSAPAADPLCLGEAPVSA